MSYITVETVTFTGSKTHGPVTFTRNGDHYKSYSGNDKVFRELGFSTAEETRFCGRFLKERSPHFNDGTWPVSEYAADQANMIHELKNLWLEKFGEGSSVKINETTYYAKRDSVAYGTKWTINLDDIEFTLILRATYLECSYPTLGHSKSTSKLERAVSDRGYDLKYEATKSFGYPAKSGGLSPSFRQYDYAAGERYAKRIIEICKIQIPSKIPIATPVYAKTIQNVDIQHKRFKVGDTVRITRASYSMEGYWTNTWVFQMSENVGNTYKILLDDGTRGILLEDRHRYPEFVLELVDESVRVPEHVIVVGKPIKSTININELDIPIML